MQNKIFRRMRGNILIRFFLFPFMNYKRKKEFEDYADSEDAAKLRAFKGIHEGKRCFIIGNGPSLTVDDLNKLKNEITLCGNRIYDIFAETTWRPTYYFCIDNDGMPEIIPQIEKNDVGIAFLGLSGRKYVLKQNSRIIFINHTNKKFVINRYNDKTTHISEDISQYFSCGYTVLFAALQFAIYTGITEIYLLGVDFNYAHYTNKWGKVKKNGNVRDYFDGKIHYGSYLNYESTLYAWKKAKEYCDEHEIKVFNATRGGKLDVFQRINFDELFEQWK